MKKSIITTLFIVLRLFCLSSQSFYYVSTIDYSLTGESIIGYFDMSTCTDTVLYTIQHEDFSGVAQFTDIAVGSDGFLYLNSSPAPCKLYRYDIQNQVFQYVATFPNTPLSFYISSLVYNANGVLFAAGAELFSYNIQTGVFTVHGNLPDNVLSVGDLTFYDGRLLLLASNSNTSSKSLYEINIQDPVNSANFLNLPTGGYGIFSYSINCDSTTVFYSGDVGQLYQINIQTGTLTPVCAPSANIFGAATTNEFLASDCSVSLDLDKDNSSGAAGGDYMLSVCGNGPAFISDTSDAEVYSGYSLDSLRFVLIPAFPGEVLSAALPLPSGISISGQGSANPVLHNNGPAQYADFQSVLRTVTWQYTGAGNAPAGPRTVVVTLFATGNRRDTASVLLDVRTPVSAGRDSSVTVCADAPAFSLASLLSADAAAGGSWLPALPGGMFDPDTQPGSQFRYVVPGGECPADTAVITVTVQPLPVFSFDNSINLCTGDTLYLETPQTALWQDGSVATSYPASHAGLYWAEVTTANGCTFRDSTFISLLPVQHTQESIQRCFGQPYAWNGQVYLSDTTVCAIFGSVFGCDSIHCITLDFLPPVTPPFITGDTLFCFGASTTFSTSGFLSYAWSVPGATGPELQVTAPGAYTVTATDSNGCTASASRSASESAPIVAVWDLHPPGCNGDTDGWIELLNIEGGQSPFSYRFDGGAPVPEPFFDNLPGGSYFIRTSGADGCFADTTLVLTEPPVLSVSLGPDIGIPPGSAYPLSAQVSGGQGAWAYAWSPPAGLSCSDCPDPVAAPSDSVAYVLSVTDANGCSATDSIRVAVQGTDFLFVPNVFSPDDDGKNDFFGVFADPDRVRSVEILRVYDRWGTLVYEASAAPFNDVNKGWNGFYRGKAAAPGVYVWYATIRLTNGEALVNAGDVWLQR